MTSVSTRHLDHLWRKLVRLMFSYRCARCSRDGHDCHHGITRSDLRYRWHPLNGVLLCRDCHDWAHSRPIEFQAWIKGSLPESSVLNPSHSFDRMSKEDVKDTLSTLLEDALRREKMLGHASMTFLPLITFAVILVYVVMAIFFRLT